MKMSKYSGFFTADKGILKKRDLGSVMEHLVSLWGLKQRRSVLFQVKRDRGGVGTTPSSLL